MIVSNAEKEISMIAEKFDQDSAVVANLGWEMQGKILDPIVSTNIKAKNKIDHDRLLSALDKISSEDKSFGYHNCFGSVGDPGVIITGMGELHLEIRCHQIERDFEIPIAVGRPRVIYKKKNVDVNDVNYYYQLEEPMAKLTIKFKSPDVTGSAISVLKNNLKVRGATDIKIDPQMEQVIEITTKVQLANMFGYAKYLRELSGGKISYSIEPDGYEFLGAVAF